jgi:small-conductance mechanosensitive channel
MEKIMKRTVQIITILFICLWVAPVFAQESSSKAMETLREEVKADKKALTAENLKLTYTEGKAFWPLYESYQKDLDKINERRASLITDYAKEYRERSLSDKKAKQLISSYLDIEEDLVKLKKSYLKKLSAVIPDKKVMTYIQMENKIQAIIRFDFALGIPLAE